MTTFTTVKADEGAGQTDRAQNHGERDSTFLIQPLNAECPYPPHAHAAGEAAHENGLLLPLREVITERLPNTHLISNGGFEKRRGLPWE